MTVSDDPADGTMGPSMVDTAALPRTGDGGRAGDRLDEPARAGRSPWTPSVPLGKAHLRAAGERIAAASPETWISLLVVAASAGWVFWTLHPDLLLTENTPTGGDMGAHVWGPNYLLHHLLPQARVTGWSPDWYAGFPAYQFYMVVPSLLVVAVHVGVRNIAVVPAVAAALGLAASGWVVPALGRWRRPLLVAGLLLALMWVPVPYGISFKLVTASGLVTLPVAACAFGKLSDLPFPVPPVLAVAALFFVYNREPTLNSGTGNIIGGNMASTMAGEFAFSISLSIAVVYLGVLVRGFRTGRHRAAAAGLLALCGLCHLIPAFFALVATALALAVWPGRARLRWLLPTMPVAGLLSAFWVLPFLGRSDFVNDMGWEKLPQPGSTAADGSEQTVWDYLVADALRWPLVIAAVGLVVAILRRQRPAVLLAACAAVAGAAFVWIPQARLWNARVLPFYYLALFLLGGVAVGLVLREVAGAVALARRRERPGPAVASAGAVVTLLAALVFLGLPLGRLPGGSYDASGQPTWLGLTRSYRNDVPGWAEYNYAGLEGKEPAGPGATLPEGQGGWPEYRDIVATMDRLGADADHGCGRAFWEYGEDRLGSYGTPMALMMLPYFTDGCIGSMEGLYFESSATTPYHFLMQCSLSEKGSCAQRDLAYGSFDLDRGLDQLELFGVKYYMAFSTTAVAAADASPRLTPVAASGPWHVYRLAAGASALATPLQYEPVVMDGVDDAQDEWLDPSAAWFMAPDRWPVPLASSGPDEWARVTLPAAPERTDDGTERRIGDRPLPEVPRRAVPPAVVSDISAGDDSLSFSVDQVGTPVLVKASYFPNWEVSGADGPYRVTPNLMVVVPTAREVSLHYGRTSLDWLALVLTLAGIVGFVVLARRPPIAMPVPSRRHPEASRRWEAPPPTGPPSLGVPPPPGYGPPVLFDQDADAHPNPGGQVPTPPLAPNDSSRHEPPPHPR